MKLDKKVIGGIAGMGIGIAVGAYISNNSSNKNITEDSLPEVSENMVARGAHVLGNFTKNVQSTIFSSETENLFNSFKSFTNHLAGLANMVEGTIAKK